MMALEQQSPTAAHWSREQYAGLFEAASGLGLRSERLAWVFEDQPGARLEKALSQTAEILAFLVARRLDAEWELENIVVAETARRRGVGTFLLNELVAQARAEQGSGIFLEVRASNQSARALYRKAGFEETGLRRSYYSNPPEDAILCRLRLY